LNANLYTNTPFFIEKARLELTCSISSNIAELIDKVEWFIPFDIVDNAGMIVDESFQFAGDHGEILTIDALNKNTHEGVYKCKVSLKNDQILESNHVHVEIFKCN
jgi:hypothetical protein